MANYPDSIYSPRTKKNRAGITYDETKETVIFAEDIKKLDEEVVAVETELGTNPKGSYDSVKEALKDLLLNKIPFTAKGDLGVAVGPVGHWKMNDNADNKTVEDASGLGNNGTAQQNTNVLTTEGKINTALSFNGTSDYITMGDLNVTEGIDEITIALWFNTADNSKWQEIITKGKYYDSASSWSLSYDGNSKRLNFSIKTRYRWVSFAPTNNQWYHVVAVYSKTKEIIKLYIDNVLRTGGGIGGTFVTIPNTTKEVKIGVGDNNYYLQGKLDDVRIYNRCLTPDEVLKIYNSGNGTEDMIPVVRVLPVGSDGQILKVDSTKPEGIGWVTP